MNNNKLILMMETADIKSQVKIIRSQTTYAYRPRNEEEKTCILEGNVPRHLIDYLVAIDQYTHNDLRWFKGEDPFITFTVDEYDLHSS